MLGAMIEHGCLSEDEQIVLEDWAHGRSVVNTAMRGSMSTRKVDKIRRRLRQKYDLIQSECGLPPREKR